VAPAYSDDDGKSYTLCNPREMVVDKPSLPSLTDKYVIHPLPERTEDKLVQRSNPPLIKHRRPGPKHPNYGIPAELWQTVVHRVVEQKETIRRIILHVQKQCGKQEA
jgi:hypothetical protein